ncbi:hypothetical protein [Roseibacillus persicicus]|uniref:Uncharacterized protein n=1 Tax=Roseibacillus persicicus TaxID=454148 RepID=A0A918TVK6_9BACT|nr:hypothetical protein [Roseibacillus persicicus]MDQ8191771.1 hypothetical protein [Roseibacillus persicicus]GHC58592.1 hypothetical protein GCM10007100_27020 [Roseibacillus persicicus]
MATLVEIKKTKQVAIFLGTGYGMYQSKSESGFSVRTNSGQSHQIALSDFNGEVMWIDAKEIRVLSIDGESPASILHQAKNPPALPPTHS